MTRGVAQLCKWNVEYLFLFPQVQQVAQLSQWDRAAGWVSFSRRWNTIFCRHRSFFSHCDVICLQSCRIRWNNAKWWLLRCSRSFNVIDTGTNRKHVCDFLLVINTNWHPISYRFEVGADYCSNFGHFALLSSLGGLGATYTVYLRLIGKLVVDFLFALTFFR